MRVDRHTVGRVVHDPKRALSILARRVRAHAWELYAARVRAPRRIVGSNFQSQYLVGREQDQRRIDRELCELGIDIRPLEIDRAGFKRFVDEVDVARQFPAYESYYRHVLYEKLLEQFTTLELAPQFAQDQSFVYLDVGSEGSIAPDVYRQLRGWSIYRQDLSYKAGVHGQYIGGDAASIPLPDESVDCIGLHCAFEHFEGESDIGLVADAQRLLRPGGRLIILPLYLAVDDAVMTDPVVSVPAAMSFPEGVDVICIPHWWNRFGRLYGAHTFQERILSQWSVGPAWVARLSAVRDIHPHCHLAYALIGEKER